MLEVLLKERLENNDDFREGEANDKNSARSSFANCNISAVVHLNATILCDFNPLFLHFADIVRHLKKRACRGSGAFMIIDFERQLEGHCMRDDCL